MMGPMLTPTAAFVLEQVEGDRQVHKQPQVAQNPLKDDDNRKMPKKPQVEQNPPADDGGLLLPSLSICDIVLPSSTSMAIVPFTKASRNSKPGKRNLHTRSQGSDHIMKSSAPINIKTLRTSACGRLPDKFAIRDTTKQFPYFLTKKIGISEAHDPPSFQIHPILQQEECHESPESLLGFSFPLC